MNQKFTNKELNTEIWKDIPDYEGYYQVSNLGRVKSLDRYIKHWRGGQSLKKGELMTPRFYGVLGKYLTCAVSKNSERKAYTIHQLVAMAFLGHKPNGFDLVVHHRDGNKINNRASNLEIVTQRENVSLHHEKNKNRSSKYVGVSWKKKKWNANISYNGRLINLGYFNSEDEAHLAYKISLSEILNGSFTHNFRIKSSKYKGVSWNKNRKKWISTIWVNYKLIHLGYFDTEKEASEYYQNALMAIENGAEIKVKKPSFSSRYRGVNWNNLTGNWRAKIYKKGKNIHLGLFKKEYDAHLAYQEARNINI